MPNDKEYVDGLEPLWEFLRCGIAKEKRFGAAALVMVIGGMLSAICLFPLPLAILSFSSTSNHTLPWFLALPLQISMPILVVSIISSVWLLFTPPKSKK